MDINYEDDVHLERGAILSDKTELEEISHTGGKVTFDVRVDAQGGASWCVIWSHSRPVPAVVFAVCAIPQGVAVGDVDLGGIDTTPPVHFLTDCERENY